MPIERLSLLIPGTHFDMAHTDLEGLTSDIVNGRGDMYMWSAASSSSSSASSPRSSSFSDLSSPPLFLVSSSTSIDASPSLNSLDLSPSICPSLLYEAPILSDSPPSERGMSPISATGARPVGSAIPVGTWSANKTTPVIRPKPRRPSEAARASEMAREVAALRQLMSARQAHPRTSTSGSSSNGNKASRKRKLNEILDRRVSFATTDMTPSSNGENARPAIRRRDESHWVDLLRMAEAKAGTPSVCGAMADIVFGRLPATPLPQA